MSIPVDGFAHVRLSVTDNSRSRAYYDQLFGLPVAFEVPAHADEETGQLLAFLYGGVIYRLGTGLLGLRPVAPGTDASPLRRFDEDRVGLDHLSFAVADRGACRGTPVDWTSSGTLTAG